MIRSIPWLQALSAPTLIPALARAQSASFCLQLLWASPQTSNAAVAVNRDQEHR
jgi:hypothetical protein